MELSLPTLVTIVSAVVGTAMLLGGAMAVLWANLKRTTKDILRDENADLTRRLAMVESREQECNARLTKAETTIQILTDTVTGKSAISELATTVAFNHDEIKARLEALLGRRMSKDE